MTIFAKKIKTTTAAAKKPKASAGKHFEFTDAVHPVYPELRQIRATKDLFWLGIKAGTVGGWISVEENLEDEAWVGKDATVYGPKARVRGNAWVRDRAQVTGASVVEEYAVISDDACVESATVKGHARIEGKASITGGSVVFGSTIVHGAGSLFVRESTISGMAYLRANGYVKGSRVSGGNFTGRLELHGANVENHSHVLQVGPIGSEGCTAIIYRTLSEEGEQGHKLKIGCWKGQLDELKEELERRKVDEWDYETKEMNALWEAQYEGFEITARAVLATWDLRG